MNNQVFRQHRQEIVYDIFEVVLTKIVDLESKNEIFPQFLAI